MYGPPKAPMGVAAGGALATTGSPVTLYVVLAAVMVLSGVLLIRGARKRRASEVAL
jgi:hypothetical protein